MVDRQTRGPVQIFHLDLGSINMALRELSERSDEQEGFRGRVISYDRHRIDSPTENTDAVDLGSLVSRESLFHLTLYMGGPVGLLAYQPGTSYVEISTLLRQQVNLSAPTSLQGRMIVSGFGTSTGSNKGVALTDSGGTVLCEVTWTGTDEQVRAGDFTEISVTTDTLAQMRTKGADATESLIIRHAAVEFRMDAGSSVAAS